MAESNLLTALEIGANPYVAGSGLAARALGGKNKGDPNYAANELAQQRQRDISYFAADLAKARQQYMANLNNLQNLTFAKFAPMAESQFASRGLEVTGGSFQAALARRAAELSATGLAENAQGQIQDLNTVQQLRQGTFGAQLGAQQPMQQQQSPLPGIAGNLSSALLTALINRSGQNAVPGSQSLAQPSQFSYGAGRRSPVSTNYGYQTSPFSPR